MHLCHRCVWDNRPIWKQLFWKQRRGICWLQSDVKGTLWRLSELWITFTIKQCFPLRLWCYFYSHQKWFLTFLTLYHFYKNSLFGLKPEVFSSWLTFSVGVINLCNSWDFFLSSTPMCVNRSWTTLCSHQRKMCLIGLLLPTVSPESMCVWVSVSV